MIETENKKKKTDAAEENASTDAAPRSGAGSDNGIALTATAAAAVLGRLNVASDPDNSNHANNFADNIHSNHWCSDDLRLFLTAMMQSPPSSPSPSSSGATDDLASSFTSTVLTSAHGPVECQRLMDLYQEALDRTRSKLLLIDAASSSAFPASNNAAEAGSMAAEEGAEKGASEGRAAEGRAAEPPTTPTTTPLTYGRMASQLLCSNAIMLDALRKFDGGLSSRAGADGDSKVQLPEWIYGYRLVARHSPLVGLRAIRNETMARRAFRDMLMCGKSGDDKNGEGGRVGMGAMEDCVTYDQWCEYLEGYEWKKAGAAVSAAAVFPAAPNFTGGGGDDANSNSRPLLVPNSGRTSHSSRDSRATIAAAADGRSPPATKEKTLQDDEAQTTKVEKKEGEESVEVKDEVEEDVLNVTSESTESIEVEPPLSTDRPKESLLLTISEKKLRTPPTGDKDGKVLRYTIDSSDKDDGGFLHVLGSPSSPRIALLCAGFPDDHRAFLPFATRLAKECDVLVGITCLPGYHDSAERPWNTYRAEGYSFQEWGAALTEAAKVLRAESTYQDGDGTRAELIGIFHDWGVLAGLMYTNHALEGGDSSLSKVGDAGIIPDRLVLFDVLFPPHPKYKTVHRLDVPRKRGLARIYASTVTWSYRFLLAGCFWLHKRVSRKLALMASGFGFSALGLLRLTPFLHPDDETIRDTVRQRNPRRDPSQLNRLMYMAYPYLNMFKAVSAGTVRESFRGGCLPLDLRMTPVLFMYGTEKRCAFHDERSIALLKREADEGGESRVVPVRNAGHWLYSQNEQECFDSVRKFIIGDKRKRADRKSKS